MFVCFLGATEESFMYLANHYESKNMSVGKVCIKRFEFACMTILSPETVSKSVFRYGYASAACSKSAQDG